MKRATVTLPDDLERQLRRFQNDADAPASVSAVVQAALREFLDQRGYGRRRLGNTRLEQNRPSERLAVDAAFEGMAEDTDLRQEASTLALEFAEADADAWRLANAPE